MVDMRDVYGESPVTIMKNAMKARDMTQVGLAEKMGMLQSALSAKLSRPRLSFDVFKDILDALDFDIVIVDRENSEAIWKVGTEK